MSWLLTVVAPVIYRHIFLSDIQLPETDVTSLQKCKQIFCFVVWNLKSHVLQNRHFCSRSKQKIQAFKAVHWKHQWKDLGENTCWWIAPAMRCRVFVGCVSIQSWLFVMCASHVALQCVFRVMWIWKTTQSLEKETFLLKLLVLCSSFSADPSTQSIE